MVKPFLFAKLKFKPTNNVCRIRELQMFFSLDLIWLFISSLVDPRWVCLVDQKTPKCFQSKRTAILAVPEGYDNY